MPGVVADISTNTNSGMNVKRQKKTMTKYVNVQSTRMDLHARSNRIKRKNFQLTFTAKVCSKNAYIYLDIC
jgi:hypothetical protein